MKYYRNTGEFTEIRASEKLVEDYLNQCELIQIENVLVDINMFKKKRWICKPDLCKFNSDDSRGGTCCDGGGMVSPEYEHIIYTQLNDIKKYLSSEKIEKIENEPLKTIPYKMNETEDECIFLASEGKRRYCALHKVAKDKNIPVYSVKSFDCCLEPLEIIIINNGDLFLTLAAEETEAFVRWGNVLGCVTKPFADAPLLIESVKDLLIYLFGSDFYIKLLNICIEL